MLNLDYSQISNTVGNQSRSDSAGEIAAGGLRKERARSEYILVLPDALQRALARAINCKSLIAPEQERIRNLQKKAKNEIEFAAREYQIAYVEKHLTRAANLAQMRADHLATITTKAHVEKELHKVQNDKAYWFKMYAWGYDPRARTPLAVVPFDLLPVQKRLVAWLDEVVFDRRTSGSIEKSRDEGATEIMVRWGLHNWLFINGFSMLLSSRKEDEVDSKKNQNTLFERIRYQMWRLPTWMLPKDFDPAADMRASMLIANPANENTLLGEAPVENMGRGGRVTCAMLDEFAFWGFAGYPQFRSLSSTTDSILMPSSVAGRLNQFADITHDGVTEKFVMDWRDNPFKDKRWYDSLPYGYIGPKMSKTTIAQEVDRNYDAAQPGKVFHIREEFNFITLDEFLRPFEAVKMAERFFEHDGHGNRTSFKIPDDARFSRYSDYGQSEGHDWSYLLAVQLSEYYPLNDTQFVFVARNLEPTGLRTVQAVEQWRGFETDLGLRDRKTGKFKRDPYASYCSHEQKTLRKVLRGRYGENWYAWKTDYEKGIEGINDWFTPIELEKSNPFRPQLMGRCQIVFVAVNPKEYVLAYNDRLNEWFVTPSETEAGFATLRKEISAYHYPETELGKAVKAMRPVKEFDDIIDSLRGLAVMWNLEPPRATLEEQYRMHLKQEAPELLLENIEKISNPETQALVLAREEFERQQFEKKQKKRHVVQDEGIGDYLREADDGGGGWNEL